MIVCDAMKCFRERYAGACYSDGYEVMLMPIKEIESTDHSHSFFITVL
jgi:hypothetical protein